MRFFSSWFPSYAWRAGKIPYKQPELQVQRALAAWQLSTPATPQLFPDFFFFFSLLLSKCQGSLLRRLPGKRSAFSKYRKAWLLISMTIHDVLRRERDTMTGASPQKVDSIINGPTSSYYCYFVLYLSCRRVCQGFWAATFSTTWSSCAPSPTALAPDSGGLRACACMQRTDPETQIHQRKWPLSRKISPKGSDRGRNITKVSPRAHWTREIKALCVHRFGVRTLKPFRLHFSSSSLHLFRVEGNVSLHWRRKQPQSESMQGLHKLKKWIKEQVYFDAKYFEIHAWFFHNTCFPWMFWRLLVWISVSAWISTLGMLLHVGSYI